MMEIRISDNDNVGRVVSLLIASGNEFRYLWFAGPNFFLPNLMGIWLKAIWRGSIILLASFHPTEQDDL
jgi:hypothetical protein